VSTVTLISSLAVSSVLRGLIVSALRLAISVPILAIRVRINFLFLDGGRGPLGRRALTYFHLSILCQCLDPLLVWVPDLSLESLSHAPAGREDDWHKCEPAQIAYSFVPPSLDFLILFIPCPSVHVEK
jgi:hypothetical protein